MVEDFRGTKIGVLDKGYVMLKDYMGTDLEPVNDAKVSYDRESAEFGDKELKLLNFLAREDHTSPFRHAALKFEVYAPLMVARQWWKYVIGSDHAESPFNELDRFLAWNESSRRYITESVEFYVVQPDAWRTAPENSKQGSGEPLPSYIGMGLTESLVQTYFEGLAKYEKAMAKGVAPELARLFLPAYGLYVRWRWTSSLQGVAHLLHQRLAHDSQKEFQLYAQAVADLSKNVFPNSIEAFLESKKG
jgi:thymidylate synthase (FAD)